MKRFCKINVILTGLLIAVGICFGTSITARAGDNLSGDNTEKGDTPGNNTCTFYYNYDPGQDAIVLTVTTSKETGTFGYEHTFSKGDGTKLSTNHPQLGSPLDGALQALINVKGLDMSVATAKAQLNSLGYYDKGNGVWVCDGGNGYLTYVEGTKVKIIEHTVSYDLAGGSGDFPNHNKREGEQLFLHNWEPTRLGYKFSHWSSSLGNFRPGDNYTHDQDGGTVTLTAQWIDVTPPMVDPATGGRATAITATPNYWSSGNGTISMHEKRIR